MSIICNVCKREPWFTDSFMECHLVAKLGITEEFTELTLEKKKELTDKMEFAELLILTWTNILIKQNSSGLQSYVVQALFNNTAKE